MVFAFSNVSNSDSPCESYAIRIPIVVSKEAFFDFGEGFGFMCCGMKVEIARSYQQYTLTIRSFRTEDDAGVWLERFSSALSLIVFRYRIGLLFDRNPTPPTIYKEAHPIADGSMLATVPGLRVGMVINGSYIGDRTVIVPEHLHLIGTQMGRGILVGETIGGDQLAEAFDMALSRLGGTTVPSRVQVAIDLYSASFFESSHSARFLALMTVLEFLCVPSKRPQPLLAILATLVSTVQSYESQYRELVGQSDFDSFIGSLRQLEERSIGSKIKTLLHDAFAGTEHEPLIASFGNLYNIRSKLVHEGSVEPEKLSEALSAMALLVPALLGTLLNKNINWPTSQSV